jgi:hypothetical protein
MLLPCMVDADLWMSDKRADQRIAAERCTGCALHRFNACREEGWNHEFGVWGGLAPVDRLKIDPERHEAGLSNLNVLSEARDSYAKAVAAESDAARLKGAIPESERQEAPAPMSPAERWSAEVGICAVEECPRRAHCRGWCVRHYHRWRATGNPLGKTGKP